MGKKRIVLKIGSSTLTSGTDRISYARIEHIARQIIVLRTDYDIILVSSGAIATAKQFVEMSDGPLEVESKQALAAIGQPKLMSIYEEVFRSFGLKTAQCLLVHRDFESNEARSNVKNTIDRLLELSYTPIINENDTVATDEIVLGDNDQLSAHVATTISANLLVLASDVNGLYTTNPTGNEAANLIPKVSSIDQAVEYVDDFGTKHGRGGMTTKLLAARICHSEGIEMWIVNGNSDNFLVNALKGEIEMTRFLPNE